MRKGRPKAAHMPSPCRLSGYYTECQRVDLSPYIVWGMTDPLYVTKRVDLSPYIVWGMTDPLYVTNFLFIEDLFFIYC